MLMFSGIDAFKVNLKANFLMCCILKDKGKKKKRKKADFWGGHMFPFFKMWLIFYGMTSIEKRNLEIWKKKKKESEREEEQRTRGEGQRPKAQTREEDKSSTGRGEDVIKRSERDRYKYK